VATPSKRKNKSVNIIDISWPISLVTTSYKNLNPVIIETIKQFDAHQVRATMLHIHSHTGTHIDAPSHFLRDGSTIDQIPLDTFIGPCTVLDLTAVSDCITREHLEPFSIHAGDIILLKTTNSFINPIAPFQPHFIYLTQSGAQYLAQCKVKAVGIDYLGIERNQPDHATHIILMKANSGILEGLRLASVQAGHYTLIALGIYTIGLEATPARAILITSPL
jgi:arylformamidase